MLRILATGDLHARHDLMTWVLDRPSDVDLVCLTGDLLLDGRLDQAPAIQAWLERFPTPVVVATGNHGLLDGHDDTWLHEVQSTNVHVDTVTTVAGVAVGAIPYLGADSRTICPLRRARRPRPAGGHEDRQGRRRRLGRPGPPRRARRGCPRAAVSALWPCRATARP